MFLTIYQQWNPYDSETVAKAWEVLDTNYHHTVEKQVGESKELFVARILRYLNANIIVVPAHTVGDEICKWDLLIEIEGKHFPLQIKSSECGRLKHERSKPQLQKQPISLAPCLVVEQTFDRARFGFALLKEVVIGLNHNGANIALTEEAQAALKLHRSLKERGIARIAGKFTKTILTGNTAQIIKDLGLGTYDRNDFVIF